MKSCDSLICPSASIKPLQIISKPPHSFRGLNLLSNLQLPQNRLSHGDGTNQSWALWWRSVCFQHLDNTNLELGTDARRFLLGVQMEQGPGCSVVLREGHDELQRVWIYEILYSKTKEHLMKSLTLFVFFTFPEVGLAHVQLGTLMLGFFLGSCQGVAMQLPSSLACCYVVATALLAGYWLDQVSDILLTDIHILPVEFWIYLQLICFLRFYKTCDQMFSILIHFKTVIYFHDDKAEVSAGFPPVFRVTWSVIILIYLFGGQETFLITFLLIITLTWSIIETFFFVEKWYTRFIWRRKFSNNV